MGAVDSTKVRDQKQHRFGTSLQSLGAGNVGQVNVSTGPTAVSSRTPVIVAIRSVEGYPGPYWFSRLSDRFDLQRLTRHESK